MQALNGQNDLTEVKFRFFLRELFALAQMVKKIAALHEFGDHEQTVWRLKRKHEFYNEWVLNFL